MKYKDYTRQCREVQVPAVKGVLASDSGPLARSEFCILRGDRDGALKAIAGIADAKVAYLQAVKACRQFEDRVFLEGRPLPDLCGETRDWLLPVLRAGGSVTQSVGEASELERYLADIPGIAGIEAVIARSLLSNAYRNAGDLHASSRVLLQAFQLAAGVNSPVAEGGVTSGPDLSFAKKRQAAFRSLLMTVDFRRYSLFPCSGTLLGLRRDGDFIPSDGDVDLGCLDADVFTELKHALGRSGRFYLSPGRLRTNFNARHVDGAKVDISLYVSRGDGLAKTSHVYEWRFRKFSLGELATDYGRLPAPESPESYLEQMYGDWQVPRSDYDSRIDSPNLVYVSPDEVVIVLANHVLDAWLHKPESLGRWQQKVGRLPAGMRGEMERYFACLPATEMTAWRRRTWCQIDRGVGTVRKPVPEASTPATTSGSSKGGSERKR